MLLVFTPSPKIFIKTLQNAVTILFKMKEVETLDTTIGAGV